MTTLICMHAMKKRPVAATLTSRYPFLAQQILWMRIAKSGKGVGSRELKLAHSQTPPETPRCDGTDPSRRGNFMQFCILVHLQWFRRNSLQKCASQPEIAKNSLKPLGGSMSFKVIDVVLRAVSRNKNCATVNSPVCLKLCYIDIGY